MERPGNTNGNLLNLECGASLAELEYSSDLQQRERRNEEKDDHGLPSLTVSASTKAGSATPEELLRSIRNILADDVVTNGHVPMFTSPFETREAQNSTGQTNIPENERYVPVPLVYCDHTASNRALESIERYIQDVCLPFYGNTHTNTSVTGSQSTAFVAEARQIVAEGCNAKITGKASQDVVLFAGNGATSVVELLVDCLGVKHYASNEETKPVVFVGPYEHHSNLLPWRESGCEIVMIPESAKTGNVDIDHLEQKLQLYGKNRLRMGAFTAASNVTGKVCDVNAIAAMLHKYGALCFFDYATGAPYLPMDMNPPATGRYTAADIAKDAIFVSPHKMIGGVQTPGILVVKKHLVNQTIAPTRSGGGTVFYVTHKHHRFLSNRIERFEGGTPNIVGILRAGLTFIVKRKVANHYLKVVNGLNEKLNEIPPTIVDYEFQTFEYVVKRLKKSAPNIIMLGTAEESKGSRKLPIFSFLVKTGDRFLHFNYVCAILNDLFGIQARGGCQCAGPYSQRLLGLTTVQNGEVVPNEINERIEHSLLHYKERAELLRPGFVRLSLPFKGLHHEEVEYVVKALEWVAKNAWVFMCQYRCNHRTGEWRHYSRQGKPLGRTERRWLSHYKSTKTSTEGENVKSLTDALDAAFHNANFQLGAARKNQRWIQQALKMTDEMVGADDDLDMLRWYVLPRECALLLTKGADDFPDTFSKNIKGGIRPEGFFEAADYKFNSPLSVFDDNTQKTGDVSSVNDIVMEEEKIEINGTVHFRDGEHQGEALFEDVVDGYNDGELSSGCLIYVAQHDEWVAIETLLMKMKKHNDSPKIESMDVEVETKPAKALPDPAPVSDKDSSREKKKPSRDSSAWGKTSTESMPLPKISTALSASNATDEVAPMKDDADEQKPEKSVKKKKFKHIKPTTKLMRYCTQAVFQWDMIQEGDRLLLGLSGGKDSLTLLHVLLELQRKLPTKFSIEVCTIDPMTPSFDPSPLIPYVESLGLKYHYIRDNIVERANSSGTNGQVVTSLCSFCARMKRGNLYATARKNNCNKLVLAQHLDDCAESFLMSVMHNGFIRTMKANYQINAGDISVIRPMVYCRESLMTNFAKANNLPIINENCPACFEEPKERARMKKLLSREETLYPNIHDNIRRSLIPIMHDDMSGILKSYTEEAVSKSRKDNRPGKKNKKRKIVETKNTMDSPETSGKKVHTEEKKDDESSKKAAPASESRDLSSFSEDELIRELAKRRADRFRTYGAMRSITKDAEGGIVDETGQVCTIDGRDGSIRCTELME